jgi:hypothetical protein
MMTIKKIQRYNNLFGLLYFFIVEKSSNNKRTRHLHGRDVIIRKSFYE